MARERSGTGGVAGRGGARRTGAGARRSRAWAAALLATALCAGSVVAAAHAQDTELTPQPKPAGSEGPAFQWAVVAGAKFNRDGELFEHSPTPNTVDFFSTAFVPPGEDGVVSGTGFFAGAQCKDNAPFAQVDDCEREPAIYQLAKDERGDQQITRVEGVGGGSGYVGAVAWIDSKTALAVGGTGTYPRREPATPVDDPHYADPAGDARAWLYEDPDGAGPLKGEWIEFQDLPDPDTGFTSTDGDEIPDAMAGLTALGCGDLSFAFRGHCLAGGLQRLWWWRPPSEAASSRFDPTPVKDVPNSAGKPDFHFRARAVQFLGNSLAYVATSGCCAAPGNPAMGPRVLTYDSEKTPNNRWQSDQTPERAHLQGFAPSRAASEAVGSAGSAVLPDSYYDFGASTVIASPGGPPTPGTSEPGSRIIRITGEDSQAHLTDRTLDSIRLLATDGNFDGNSLSPDWSVGRLKESELGIAYTTTPMLIEPPNPLSCNLLLLETSCEPIPENLTEASVESRRLVGMGTYSLNTIAFVPGTRGGTVWAAGDRGALARLGGEGNVGSQDEPQAPFIRARGASALAKREPFEPFRPSPVTQPGVVAPLSAQPLTKLSEPALVPYGTDNPMPLGSEEVSAFAMSRDGSEGWALGTTPHHFDGERWLSCDQNALPPPDDACASLLEASKGVTPTTITRIPLERDSDPTNDEEFAAVAVGHDPAGEVTVLSYREATLWEIDSQASKELQSDTSDLSGAEVVFRAPDDGWLTGHPSQSHATRLYHYSGGEWPNGHWKTCVVAATAIANCGRGISAVPISGVVRPQIAGNTLFLAGTRLAAGAGDASVTYPFVAAKELDSNAPWRMEYDPGCPESQTHPPDSQGAPRCSGSPDGAAAQGTVSSLSVLERDDEGVAGWLLGRFGSSLSGTSVDSLDAVRRARKLIGSSGNLIRRDPDSGSWSLRTTEDAASDYLSSGAGANSKVMSLRGPDGEERAVIVPGSTNNVGRHPWLAYDARRDRWELLPTPFATNNPKFLGNRTLGPLAGPLASSPDGQGGFWVAVKQGIRSTVNVDAEPVNKLPTYFYHYTDRAPEPVFEDAPHPIREMISDLDGTADGTVWVSTHSRRLYRYDRMTGWERAEVPGWDPGRTATTPSHALAVAVNDSGIGVAVGEEGRIADISPNSVRLDEASGRRCSDVPPPCGTPQDLRAAAVAPDGSALVGGDNLTLMWRPAEGDFRLVSGPQIPVSTQITDITMPVTDEAWLTTADGQIWKGMLIESNWKWGKSPESPSSTAADETGSFRLNDIAVDAAGRGLAVGSSGVMLERLPEGTWHRLNTGYLDSLHSIALPPSGYGDGTLIGGSVGVVLTRVNGTFHYARRSDIFDPVTNGHGATAAARIVGVAVAGGASDGELEAWAASQIPPSWSKRPEPTGALFHYASGEDPLLSPEGRSAPLADTPASKPSELTLAAFGRSECQVDVRPRFCPEFQGTNMFNEAVSRQIQAEVGARADEAEGGLVALFTGDINSAPGRECCFFTPLDANVTHNAWRQFVPESLAEEGIPLLSALGMNDLWNASECVTLTQCLATRDIDGAGLSLQWRSTFAGMPSPWGQGDDTRSEGLEFEPVNASPLGVKVDDGSARTHYAADIVRDDEPLARLVIVDNSLGSLAESTVNQNPVEEQQVWLEGALCFEGSPEDTDDDLHDCTRERGQEAIVLGNYPTYTYATNISPTDVATDAALFESTLLRFDVDVLIAGRLGWNGLYYTCAPGLHYPHPGQGYPERAPKGLAECAAAAGGADAPSQLSDLASDATDAVSGTPTGALPVVVASGAGGRFGPRGDSQGSASEGFWRGYAIVRIDPETGKIAVEQRPVVDWVGLDTPQLVIEPGERFELRGYGREPGSIDAPLRYIEIDSPAVTHRYDLLLADPDEPWVPCEAADEGCVSLHSKLAGGSRSFDSAAAFGSGSAQDDSSFAAAGSGGDNACEPYLCLPENVAAIDDQTGEVRSGNGKYPDTFAIAMLSMGDRVATQPLYFKRSPSFVVAPAVGFPAIPSTPTSTAGAPAPPPPPPPPTPNVPQVSTPTPPTPPPIAPLQAAQPPEPQPPAPPAPPPPTEQPSPLSLTLAPPSITVATPTAVIQPPTPPVNPAPPGGARREARQRQAAAQKSGADSPEEGMSDARNLGGDPANAPDSPDQRMTRRDRTRPEPSFTAIARADQPSVWPQALLYTGALTVMAAALAAGWSRGRPTPRRREPRLPAPAYSELRRRGQ